MPRNVRPASDAAPLMLPPDATPAQMEVLARPSEMPPLDAAERMATLLRRLSFLRHREEESGHRFLDTNGVPLPTLSEEGFIVE